MGEIVVKPTFTPPDRPHRCDMPIDGWRTWDDGTPSAPIRFDGVVWRCPCGQHWLARHGAWLRRSPRWVARYRRRLERKGRLA